MKKKTRASHEWNFIISTDRNHPPQYNDEHHLSLHVTKKNFSTLDTDLPAFVPSRPAVSVKVMSSCFFFVIFLLPGYRLNGKVIFVRDNEW